VHGSGNPRQSSPAAAACVASPALFAATSSMKRSLSSSYRLNPFHSATYPDNYL